jgi:hypothetical protein
VTRREEGVEAAHEDKMGHEVKPWVVWLFTKLGLASKLQPTVVCFLIKRGNGKGCLARHRTDSAG